MVIPWQVVEDSMKKHKSPLTRQQEDRRYLWIIIAFLIIVGSAVIYIVYGANALILAVPILIGGSLLLTIPFMLLGWLDWLIKRLKDRD